VLAQVSPRAAVARRALWAYMDDVVGRYHGRPATAAEVEAALRAFPSEDLEPPNGLFVVAVQDGSPVGCAGLRLLPGALGEVTRVHVAPAARRRGLGTRLMCELERLAREHGRTTLRLDTRSDLVEARRLDARLGYRAAPAFDAGPHAEHWLAKTLT
jgi:ribosomal protein S18 acetylase RimI-like enzyme